MSKTLTKDQHVKRAMIGGGITLTGIGAPIALPYAGWHTYKAATSNSNSSNNGHNAKFHNAKNMSGAHQF